MSFPVLPTNGQNSVVNGITYSYSTATSSWTRVAGQVTSTTYLSITNATASTGTTTGALLVAGGIGVGGSVYISGTVVGGGIRSTTGTTPPSNPTVGDIWYNSSADITYRYTDNGSGYNVWLDITGPAGSSGGGGGGGAGISGGTAGQLVYMSAPDTTAFAGPGTTGQILVSAGTSAPTYTSTGSIYVGNAAVANILNPGNTSTQQVGYAENILGNGVGNGSLLYQSSADNTAFLAQGSAGWLMVSGGAGNPPAFTNTSSIYVNSAVNSNNIIGGSTNQIPYQSSAGNTAFNASLTFDPGTGVLSCTDINTTSDLSMKDNVATISNPHDILRNLRGVQFNWKQSGKLSYGLIAQELEETLPELVGTNQTGLKSISYLPLIGILLEAIKSQQDQIDKLMEKIK